MLTSNNLYPATLFLQDGTLYKGWSLFRLSLQFGEIVFNTGMTGYQEIFTDPSYSGQLVVFTYPELGNTGLNNEDSESNFIHVKGLIAKNISIFSNNWRSCISLKDYIILKRIPHIFGIDTRSLARHIRSSGVMSAIISDHKVSSYRFDDWYLDKVDLIRRVTSKHAYNIKINDYKSYNKSAPIYFNLNKSHKLVSKYRIVVMDFGLKFSIIRKLLFIGCEVHVVPATYSYNAILAINPDGLLLSNGPGNPLLAIYAINTVKKLIYFSNIPVFGICMGHQVLNLALGANTFKLKFGHRGLNHPVGLNNYAEVTSQNHGFAVIQDSLKTSEILDLIVVNQLNLNDFTIASTLNQNSPILSVQYHPEANPGPHDSEYLFQTFIQLIDTVTLTK
uniref:Carbamoyl phosphate synthase small chain n=1 Tax=Kuetzingia canaliculata TaxID=228262 RepID=A0A1Z1MPJ6_KUECA|nr:carbamoyl phosphate synthase small subunit [Kuetzingia canaliculata]ARW67779.1 carbamoyl phosphate synthase small subunit [Kuetzingia canaliculata]